MTAEVVATIAVGAPATLIAIAVYISSRSKDQREAARQLFADMLAPVLVRVTNLEEDVSDIRNGRRGRHND